MSSLQEKIRYLLNKAEGTDNDHERDAYNAKAEELMLKYGIEQAELEAGGQVNTEEIVTCTMVFNTPQWNAIVGSWVQNICNSLGGLSVLQVSGQKQRTIYIIGHKSDVDAAQMLVDSLWKQALTAVRRWAKRAMTDDPMYRYLDNQKRWLSRRQFIVSFGYGAAERILSERTDLQNTVSSSTALVLVSRQERVDDFVQATYHPKESRTRTLGGYTGAAEGRAAGRRANVGAGRGALQ